METYDVIVIGAGPVGENAADRARRGGLSVALIEAELVGGECSYWACMPSKTLLRPGAARAAATGIPGLPEPGALDPAAIFAWRDRVTGEGDDQGQEDWLASVGITLIRGHGRLAGTRRVEVTAGELPEGEATTRTLEARRAVVVATGSVPVLPEVPGLAEASPWSSRDATAADAVPESLIILGGGVVGCEMATAYADLGSRVTLIARGGLLGSAEPFAGAAVADSLRAAAVDVRTGTSVSRVERHGESVTVTVGSGDEAQQLTATELLVATGRTPRTGDLGLESIGLDPRAALAIDDTTAVLTARGGSDSEEAPWLYACGDVTGRVATTHQGKYQARVCGDVLAATFGTAAGTDGASSDGAADAPHTTPAHAPHSSPLRATADHGAQAQVVFTRPQVAWVGLTRSQADAAGRTVDEVAVDLSSAAGAGVTHPDYAGRAHVLVDRERRVIVGATFVGPDAGEMLHAATIAIVGEVTMDRLWHAVPAFPTVSEVWLRLCETYGL